MIVHVIYSVNFRKFKILLTNKQIYATALFSDSAYCLTEVNNKICFQGNDFIII